MSIYTFTIMCFSDDERGVGLDTESTGAVQELGPAGSLDEPEPIDEGINKVIMIVLYIICNWDDFQP